MKRTFTFLFAAMLVCVGAMAQKAHQRVSHEGWVVTALNEAGTYGNEGGVAFIADDNPATFYHSNWGGGYDDGTSGKNKGQDGLQAFMVELPHSLSDLSLITYKGRSDNNNSGWARGVRVYVYETLPTGWPEKGLSSLSYKDKEALLAKDNANLGTAAFNNTEKPWTNDKSQKLVEFATPQKGKYVLFVMDSGHDAWLTCSDFQIYQYKAYDGIVEGKSYILQVLNAAATGIKYVDTFTGIDETSGKTISISDNAVETYFAWDTDAWLISTNEAVDGNYVKTSKWCANPQSNEKGKWELFVNDDQSLSILQRAYDGSNDNSRCFVGGDVVTNKDVIKLFTDNAKDKAINVKVVDASEKPVTVKYVFTYNDEVKGEPQLVETFSGEEYPAVTATFPYGISFEKPTGKIDASEAVEGVVTKNIVLQDALPFVGAADVKSVKNWYHLIFHATVKNYLYYTADDAVLEANKKAVESSAKDAYTWAFVGNPFDGFKVYNKKAGKFLDAAKDGAVVAAAGEQVFTLTSSNHGTNGFFMQAKDGDYTERFNRQNDKVVYWSGADAGSTFMVELRDDSESLRQLVASANELLTALGEGTTVGCITTESKAAINDAIAAANTALENKTGYETAEIALQAAVVGVKTVQPNTEKFYLIKSAMASTDARGGQMMYVNKEGAMQFRPEYNDSAVFKFVEAGNGQFHLLNVVNNAYLSTAKAHNGGQAEVKAKTVEEAKAVVITNMGRTNVVKIVPVGGAMLHAQAAGSKVVAWDNEDNTNASAWIIEEFAIPVSGVTLDKTEATLTEAGATVTLVATVAPENAADKTVTWSTSDDKVATVVDGVVTAVANGKATITAKAGEKTATCEVTVAIPVVDPNDYTSYIKNAAVTSAEGWNIGAGKHEGGLMKYTSGKLVDFNQTITLPAGQYKMTAKAAYRYTYSEQSEYEAIQAGTNTHLAKLYAETATYKYEGNVMNRYEGASDTDYAAGSGSVTVNGKFVPNSSSAVLKWFEAGQYVNEIVFNVQEEGEVKIGIETKENVPSGEYTNISAWTLTRLGDAEADPKAEPEYLTVVGAKVGDVAIVEGKATVESISSFDITFDRPVALNEEADWATLVDPWETRSLKAEVLEAEEGSSEYVVRFSIWDWEEPYTTAHDYILNIPEGLIVGADDANYINAAIEAVITIEAAPVTPLTVTNVTVGEDVMSDLSAIVAAPETMIKVNFDGKFYFQGEPSFVDAEGEDASSSFDYMNGLDFDGSNSYIFMGKKEGTYTITLAKAQFNELEMMGWKAPAEDIVLKVTVSKVDGIQNINVDADAVIYDIHGRRVEKMTKGLYIVNGKKVLVK